MPHSGRNETANGSTSDNSGGRIHSHSRSPPARGGSSSVTFGDAPAAPASVVDIQDEVRKALESGETVSRFSASVTAAVSESTKDLVVSTITTVVAPIQAKLGELETSVANLAAGQTDIKDELRVIKESLEKLGTKDANQSYRGMVGSPSLPTIPSPSATPQNPVSLEATVFTQSGFYRQPDPTILLCNTQNGTKVPRAKFC